MPWYYANNNQRLGPVNDLEFARLAREKIILEDTLVWQHGMPDWKSYKEVAAGLPSLESVPPMPVVPRTGSSPMPDAATILAEQPVRLNYAGFWVRAGAKLIDLFILNVLVLLVATLLQKMPAVPTSTGVDEIEKFIHEMAVLSRISIGINLVYCWFFVWLFQGTPGKIVLGLKIVGSNGSRIGPARIFFRFLAELMNQMLFGFGYLLAATDDQKRTMHDFMCDTRVVAKIRK